MAFQPPYRGHKRDRENTRAAKREAKADRLAQRRAEKISGVEIDSLPSDMQGLARTLANGGHDAPAT
jgi:hypothetical protein